MGEIPHNWIDLAYVAAVVFLSYLGLKLKTIMLQNKIDIMESIKGATDKLGDKQNETHTTLTEHIAIDESEFRQINKQLDRLNARP